MPGRRKNVVIEKGDIEALKSYFGSGKKPTKKFLFFLNLFSKKILPVNILKNMVNGTLSPCEKVVVESFEALFDKMNVELCSPLFAQLKSKQKKLIYFAGDMSDVERHILSLMINMHKEKKYISIKQILFQLRLFGYIRDESNIHLYTNLIKKVRRRFYYLKEKGKLDL